VFLKIIFPTTLCMLDWEIVWRYYEEWNEGVSTIKREHWLDINIMLLHITSWWVWFFQNVLVSSKWTRQIRFLVNFITLNWTTFIC
jgi:hypothetical protein